MFLDGINVKGDVHIKIYDTETGIIKQEFKHPNLVVATGKQFIASRLAGLTPSLSITHMAIGSGTTTPTASDTTLSTQVSNRVAITSNVYVSGNSYVTISATFPGSTYISSSITEAGLFTASSGSNAVCRTTFGSFAILSTDTIAITWTLSIL